MAGRPRSARAHHSVLDAAVGLFAERGIDGTSMDAIARVSGVSKATIYKHWPDKEALALEMLDYLHRLEEWPETTSGDVKADIVALLARRPSPRTAAIREKIMPHLISYASRHEAFQKVWRARLLQPTRERLTRLMHRAIAEGRLPLGFDCDVGVALLLGPMLYHWMSTMAGQKLPDDLPARIVDGFWRAYGTAAAAPAESEELRPRRHKRRH